MSNRASAVQSGHTSTHQSTSPVKEASFDSSGSEIAQHPEWISKCRKILISTETTNIASRVCHWRRIVNEKTDLTNERLNIFIPQNSIPKFEWNVHNLSKYIQFVIQWNGLKMKQIKNSPANYEDYERKARNWLNGRRAPNYAGTLFPDMIKSSEQYADTISKQLFGPNNQYSKAYQKILMFGYLHALCSVRISMNDVSKKTFLLCENSIKTNSVTSVLLQQYATDHPFPQYFPSHLKQAADYFQNKFEMDIKRFGNALRLAAGNNMSVNQLNPTMQSVQTTLTIGGRIPSLHNNTINGITGLTINDLNNLHSIGLSNYVHGLNGLQSLNDVQLTTNGQYIRINPNKNANQPNSSNIDPTSDMNLDKKAKDTVLLSSPVSLTHSNGTTSTTSINTNPFNSASSSASCDGNTMPMQIPNLSMPPQITQLTSNSHNKRASTSSNHNTNNNDALIRVNGKPQSVVSFLNQIVNTCNTQQLYMKRLQNRVQSMEQILRQLQPQIMANNRNQLTQLQPLPRVEQMDSLPQQSTSLISTTSHPQPHLQFILQPQAPLASLNTNNASQLSTFHGQFKQIAQQIQPIHVQQMRSSSIPQQQFVLNPQTRPLPNMVATPSHARSKPIMKAMHGAGKTNIKLANTVNTPHIMDDASAAALLASLKHTMEPKLETSHSKRLREPVDENTTNNTNNRRPPPSKKRKIDGGV